MPSSLTTLYEFPPCLLVLLSIVFWMITCECNLDWLLPCFGLGRQARPMNWVCNLDAQACVVMSAFLFPLLLVVWQKIDMFANVLYWPPPPVTKNWENQWGCFGSCLLPYVVVEGYWKCMWLLLFFKLLLSFVCVCCSSSISMVGFLFFHVFHAVVGQKTCLQGKWLCIMQRTLEYSERRLFACVGCWCTWVPYVLCTPWYGFYFPLNILS